MGGNEIDTVPFFSLRNIVRCGLPGVVETTFNMPWITSLNMIVTQGKVTWTPRALYRGWTVTCIPYIPYKLAMFGSKNKLYNYFPYKIYDESKEHVVGVKVKEALLVGGLSGAIAGCVVTPIERVQVYQNAQNLGLSPALKQIYKTRGMSGFFTGLPGTVLRDVPFSIALFAISDIFETALLNRTRKFTDKNPKYTLLVSSVARILAGSIFGVITSPINNIKIAQQGYHAQERATFMQAAKKLHSQKTIMNGWEFRVIRIGLGVLYLRAAYSVAEKFFANLEEKKNKQ